MNMADRLVESLGQIHPRKNGKNDRKNNSAVFQAASLALASNMGRWSTFLNRRKEFESLLENYNPVAFSKAVDSDRSRIQQVKECLGGLTGGKDAKAIGKWAYSLGKDIEYYQALEELRDNISRLVRTEEVVPVLAAFLGDPKKRIEKQWPPPPGMETWKAPGMRMPLASEFLRNLHWEGFKPDRHIKRLFLRWFPGVVEKKSERADHLARHVLCGRSKDLIEDIKFSLVGAAVTPDGCSRTKADNLVWALGAYVETKNKESDTVYWKTIRLE
ncbi:MAG: hypothetical protein OXG10_04480 [Candidatus Dadabacteria bacterium]|nr:hypothetical protein [Candidatus Dadabacteria bacterium]